VHPVTCGRGSRPGVAVSAGRTESPIRPPVATGTTGSLGSLGADGGDWPGAVVPPGTGGDDSGGAGPPGL